MNEAPANRQRSTLWVRLSACAISVLLALGIAETAASALHRGAFPYLNLFVADAQYGVRLEASSSTRVRSRDGRITELSTNSLGFRGPEWASPSGARSVLLLGDSQVMGYGVPWSSTMTARLEQLSGARAFAAAVPSWGPHESLLALSELGPRLRPTHVVFVANGANDWFESAPNVRRTTARDGWAASPSSARGVDFPLRGLLLGRSHLVLAVRQLAHVIGRAEQPAAEPALRLAHDVAALRAGHGAFRSALGPSLSRAVELCRPLGCEVIAVALPLDVQVSPAEWAKYRSKGTDMTATEALLEDFVADARGLGVPAVDLLPALRAAEPGAFLPDDYHLSASGHDVAARAIAAALRRGSGEQVRR